MFILKDTLKMIKFQEKVYYLFKKIFICKIIKEYNIMKMGKNVMKEIGKIVLFMEPVNFWLVFHTFYKIFSNK